MSFAATPFHNTQEMLFSIIMDTRAMACSADFAAACRSFDTLSDIGWPSSRDWPGISAVFSRFYFYFISLVRLSHLRRANIIEAGAHARQLLVSGRQRLLSLIPARNRLFTAARCRLCRSLSATTYAVATLRWRCLLHRVYLTGRQGKPLTR